MVPPDDAAPTTDDATEAGEAARRDWLEDTDKRIAALGERAARFSAFPPGDPAAARGAAVAAAHTASTAAQTPAEVLRVPAGARPAGPARWGRTKRRRGRGGVS